MPILSDLGIEFSAEPEIFEVQISSRGKRPAVACQAITSVLAAPAT